MLKHDRIAKGEVIKMKKVISLILVLVMLFALVGCNNKKDTTTTDEKTNVSTTIANEDVTYSEDSDVALDDNIDESNVVDETLGETKTPITENDDEKVNVSTENSNNSKPSEKPTTSNTKPSVKPTQPDTQKPTPKPTQPSVKPTTPSTKPTTPSTKPTQPKPTQPKPTQPSTKPTTPSTTEKPYFVSLELIKTDRPNSYNVDGMPVLDRVFGKNTCFQKGDTLTYKVNMSNGGNTGFKLVGYEYCSVKINGNIITMKITAVDTYAAFRLKVDTKTGTTEITEKVKAYWWDGKLNKDAPTRQLIEDYAYKKGLTRIDGQPNAYDGCVIEIPGNPDWFSELLAFMDRVEKAGCTKYTYQYIGGYSVDIGAYK